MAYAVYCEPDLRDRVEEILRTSFEIQTAKTWNAFFELAPNCSCSIVAMRAFEDEREVARLRTSRERFPARPLVLVTRRDPENLRRLSTVRAEEVVWVSEMRQRLEAAVRTACAKQFLDDVSRAVITDEALPPELGRVLRLALESPRPFFAVTELCSAAGVSYSTLKRHWRQATHGQLTLKRVLDWIAVYRARAMNEPRSSWKEVAQRLEVDPRTLRRISESTMGLSLRRLGRCPLAVVAQRFRASVLNELDWDQSSLDLAFLDEAPSGR